MSNMGALNEIIETLAVTLGAVIGPNPPLGGVSIVQSGGGLPDKHLDANMISRAQIILTSKDKDQNTALEMAFNAHKTLTKTFTYTSGDAWQIYDIATITFPELATIEPEGAYLYTSVLEITYYWRD